MISEKFIEECKNRANANRLGKIIVDGMENPITNSDNLQSFSIDSGCYVNGNIIGSVYAKCLKASFITDIADLSGKTTYAQIGVKYDDSTTEYAKMGKYIVEHPNNEITANMSQITAYDDLYTNLDNQYVCGIDYSKGNVTIKDLYIDVCKQLELTPKTTSFLNDNIPIENNPFTNKEKNRTILQTIGKISCSFIDIDVETNEIDLCWVSQSEEPDYIFYKNDYASVDGGQVICGPINCLIIKNSQIDSENVTKKDDEDIALNGEHSITISEDYILHNEELRQQAITNIWNRVHGMKYVDCKLTTYYGKPFMKLGTRIRIYIDDDNTEYIDTYVLKHNFTYDGSFNSVIESPALTQQEIKAKQDISLGEALKNTQIDVDKQNQKINEMVKSVEETTKNVDELTKSINLFNPYLSQETFIISTDTDKKPLETKEYEIKTESYFKGIKVTPTISINNSHDGITIKEKNEIIIVSVDSSVIISEISNEYEINFKYLNDGTSYSINKKLTISLALSGKNGENGQDGESTYQHIRYSQNKSGDPMTTSAEGAIYLGIAITNSPTAPTTPSSYNWTKIKGDNGEVGKDGAKGDKGDKGDKGSNGTSSYLHIKWSKDGETFSTPNLNSGRLISGFISTSGEFEESSATYPNSKYFEPFILKNGDTINIELPESKDFRLRLFETDDKWITTVSLNGKETSYKNSRGRDIKVYILFYSGISQEDANKVIYYKQSEIGKEPARYQGTYVDTNSTDSENFEDYNWVDTAIVVNEEIEAIKTNIAQVELNINNIEYTVGETIETTNTIKQNITEMKQTTDGLSIDVSEANRQLDTLSETIKGMNYNFTTDALKIAKPDDPNSASIDNTGMKVYTHGDLRLISNQNGTGVQKLIVVGDAQLGYMRIIKNTDDKGKKCTDHHYLESNIETLEDLEGDGNGNS